MISPYRIGLIGFGNIGTGLVKHLVSEAELLADRLHGGIELVAIADKDIETPRDVTPPENTWLTTDWRKVVGDESIDLIVELVGVGRDGKPTLALDIARATLESGKHFVTANKGLIAAYGGELHELAEKNAVLCLYEASVGAGTPIIGTMQTTLAPNRIRGIYGLVNGTCNYVLTQMDEDTHRELEAVIAEAVRLGYAEPDPTFDIGGHDSAYKIAILGSLAFNQELTFDHVRMEGLTSLGEPEFEYARMHDLSVKLMASAELFEDGTVDVSVGPVFVPTWHVLTGVRDVFNGVLIEAEPIGETMYYGAGAGRPSTASGLISDIMLAAKVQRAKAPNPYPLKIPRGHANIRASERIHHRHYVRLNSEKSGDLDALDLLDVPGEYYERHDAQAVLVTDRISLKEFDNLLGKLRSAGVSYISSAHVRFAFEY